MQRWVLPLAVVAAIAVGVWVSWEWLTRNPDGLSLRELAQRSGEAYIYAYPMLVVDQTRTQMLAAPATEARPRFQINRLSHIRGLPRFGDDAVVRPNLDTLYSIAWLDLTQGPVVLRWPEMGDRYWLFQVLDGTTNVAGAPGTRTFGSGPGAAMISGPNWQGPALPGMIHIRVETEVAWIIGRIEVDRDPTDQQAVHQLQDQFSLTGRRPSGSSLPELIGADLSTNPNARLGERPSDVIASLSADELFGRFFRLAAWYETPSGGQRLLTDQAALQSTLSHGDHGQWGWLARHARQRGIDAARERLAEGVAERPYGPTGWRTLREGVGDFGDDYALRAGVAMIGLGANLPDDAIYPTTDIDSDGRTLDGRFDYMIRFEPGALPPAGAFWSITAYDADGFLMDTMAPAYLSHADLIYDADGGATVIIGAHRYFEVPPNLIAVAPEPFQLTARLYLPGETALSGKWEMPPVERLR